jgi:hypothetical protein
LLKIRIMRIFSIKFCKAKLDYNFQRSHPWQANNNRVAPKPPLSKKQLSCVIFFCKDGGAAGENECNPLWKFAA